MSALDHRWMYLLALLGLAACDDAATSTPGEADMDVRDARVVVYPDEGVEVEPDAAAPAPDATPDAELLPDATPPPSVAWVEVSVSPRLPLYTLSSTMQVSLAVFDRVGEPLQGLPVRWTVSPDESATVDDAGVVSFLEEGAGTIRGCVPSGAQGNPVCAQAAFYVDDGPPTLMVDSPPRGAVLGGDLSQTISVRGHALDAGGQVSVRINGQRVDVTEAGAFSLDLPAKFGFNRVVITADDGVRQPPVREVRDVLWAPAYGSVEAGGVSVGEAMWLNLEQGALADGPQPTPPDEQGRVRIEELSTLVQTLVEMIEPEALLGPLGLGDGLDLQLLGADLGPVELSMGWINGGLEIFLRLPRLSLQVDGALALEGEPISLEGTLTAAVAGFATVSIDLSDGALEVDLEGSLVALESLGGDLVDPRAQAVLSTFGSQFRGVVEEAMDEVLRSLLIEQLPTLLTDAILGLTGALSDLPLNLNTGVEGVEPVRMRLALTATAAETARNGALDMRFSGEIVHLSEAIVSPHPSPGLPLFADGSPPPEAAAGPLTLAIKLDLVNAILHEVWRAGLLTQAPALPEAAQGLVDGVTLDGLLPPMVVPADPWAQAPLEAQLGALMIEVVRPGAEAPDVYALSLRSGLDLISGPEGLTLVLDETPDVLAHYLGGPNPAAAFPEALVAQLVGSTVWPAVGETLAGGLALPVGLSPVPVEALQAAAPDLQGMALGPVFPRGARLIDDWVVLEGALIGEITLQLE